MKRPRVIDLQGRYPERKKNSKWLLSDSIDMMFLR